MATRHNVALRARPFSMSLIIAACDACRPPSLVKKCIKFSGRRGAVVLCKTCREALAWGVIRRIDHSDE